MKTSSERISVPHAFDRDAPVAGALSKLGFLAALGLLAAGIDLLAVFTYWSQQGVAPTQVLRSIAAWALGPHPPATGPVFALGLSVHYFIYLSMVVVFDALLARRRRHLRQWFLPGAIFGVSFYVIVFRLLVPILVFPVTINRSPEWIATCLLLHGLVIGPLLARVLTRRV